MIVTGNHWCKRSWDQFCEQVAFPLLELRGVPLCGFSGMPLLRAEVRQGRWVVLCPWCRGAELAWEEQLFLCLSCCNAGVGHQLVPVVFPQERRAIEAVLDQRPLPNRNWLLQETVLDLLRENEDHRQELLIWPGQRLLPV